MSNRGYSPGALERRKKKAREAYRNKYATDQEFRESERKRSKTYYGDHAEYERERSARNFARTKDHHQYLARTRCPEITAVNRAIRDYRFGKIEFDELNRRVSESYVQLDERIARESTSTRSPVVRSRPSPGRMRLRRPNPQTDEAKVRCAQNIPKVSKTPSFRRKSAKMVDETAQNVHLTRSKRT